jgi:DNA-binding beta-propeller fold protein YncE
VKPASHGVGEAFVDTQFEMSAGKTKPGSLTGFDTGTWEMTKKFFLPQINLNNPHNMALSRDQNTIFQSQWSSDKVTAIDRETGKEMRTTDVGPSPSHVMRRPGTDTLLVPNNGGNRLVELDPEGKKVIKSYLTQAPGQDPAFPHAHWVSFDGKHVVTPNSNESQASIFDLSVPSMVKPESGGFPVATSMSMDGKRAYVANLLDHTAG